MDRNLEEILDEFCGSNKMYRDIVDEVEYKSQDYDGDDKEKFIRVLEDINYSGLASGIVGSLIYYDDTTKFFETYYDEISDELYNMENAGLEPMKLLKSEYSMDDVSIMMCDQYSKNYIVWMVYAFVCGDLLDVLKNE